MKKTGHVENCGQVCSDGRFELIDKIEKDIIRATNITKDEEKVLSNILFRLWQRDWLRNSNDIAWLESKAEAYDKLMSGGKKTLKEWANIFGTNVAINHNGDGVVSVTPLEFNTLSDGYKIAGYWSVRPGYPCTIFNLPHYFIDYIGDWKDSLTLPDGWEKR